MSDLISRQAAIDAIKRCESADSYDLNNGLIIAMNAVADVPTIGPVKHGKWKLLPSELISDDGLWGETCYVCSNCGKLRHFPYPYCPNCGAKMEQK